MQSSSADSPTQPTTKSVGATVPCSFEQLPSYSRSLLKIELPVSVTLADKKWPISEMLRLVPGSIIQFEKMCDESLTLQVGNQAVAKGEAVKVGDKFGLRIISMVMPDERFQPIEKSESQADTT